MAGEQSQIEFVLNDTVGGREMTPATVDLPTIRGFFQDVERLVKGDVPGASLADSTVQLKTGSLVLSVVASAPLVASTLADLARLADTGDLDSIDRNRAVVVEGWQRLAKRQPSRSYSVRAPGQAAFHPWVVNSASRYEHGGEEAWVMVKKYLTGKLVNLGGKSDPNIHLVPAGDGRMLKISASEEQLSAEKENLLYKEVTLLVEARQHLRKGQLENIRLIEFLHPSRVVDEAALERLWAKGRVAWRGVPSATAWVEELRGH